MFLRGKKWRGTFRFRGIFRGIAKKPKHSRPANKPHKALSSIPSLAPLINFRWCQNHLKAKKPAQCGLFVVCVKPAPATKVQLARGARLGQHPGKALAGNSLCRSTLSTPAKWR